MAQQHAEPNGTLIDSRLLRLILPLDAAASAALVVVVLVIVPVLGRWGTSSLTWVIGLLLIGYAVALAAMGAVMACILARSSTRGPVELPPSWWLALPWARQPETDDRGQ